MRRNPDHRWLEVELCEACGVFSEAVQWPFASITLNCRLARVVNRDAEQRSRDERVGSCLLQRNRGAGRRSECTAESNVEDVVLRDSVRPTWC